MSCEIRVTIGPIRDSVTKKKEGKLSAAAQAALQQGAEAEARANMDAELSRRAAFIHCSGTCTPHFLHPSISVTSSVEVEGLFRKETVVTAEAVGILVVECRKPSSDSGFEPELNPEDSEHVDTDPGHEEEPGGPLDPSSCPCDEGVITIGPVTMSGEDESFYFARNDLLTYAQIKQAAEVGATNEAIKATKAELIALAKDVHCTGNCNKDVSLPAITSPGPATSTSSWFLFHPDNRKVEAKSSATGEIRIRCENP